MILKNTIYFVTLSLGNASVLMGFSFFLQLLLEIMYVASKSQNGVIIHYINSPIGRGYTAIRFGSSWFVYSFLPLSVAAQRLWVLHHYSYF